ncbi:MAG: Crp/Fnr family transcriptional regulator [Limisphaerales bacterium]
MSASTYHVWGLDRAAYGPVPPDILADWVTDGRVFPHTWLYAEPPGEWRPASDWPEIAAKFPKAESATPAAPAKPAAAPAAAPGTPVAAKGVRPAILRRMRMFAAMSDEQIATLAKYLEEVTIAPFKHAVRQGDPADAMFLVAAGEVRARIVIDGAETTLATMKVGEAFGEVAIFDDGPRSADVIANVESVLLRISKDTVAKLMAEAPGLATPLLAAICHLLTTRIRADNKRLDAAVRMARAGKEAM